jgi:hypothetical protein
MKGEYKMAPKKPRLNGTNINEMEHAHTISSIFVNRFIISTTSETLRLTLGEKSANDTETFMRSSVTMSLQNAAALKDLLHKVLSEVTVVEKLTDEK